MVSYCGHWCSELSLKYTGKRYRESCHDDYRTLLMVVREEDGKPLVGMYTKWGKIELDPFDHVIVKINEEEVDSTRPRLRNRPTPTR